MGEGPGRLDPQHPLRLAAETLRYWGIHIFPTGPDKIPTGKWRRGEQDFVVDPPSDDCVEAWLLDPRTQGWAALPDGPHLSAVFDVEAAGLGQPAVRAVANRLRISYQDAATGTLRGGAHVYVTLTDWSLDLDLPTQLASNGASGTDKELWVEVRRPGQYAVPVGPGRPELSVAFAPGVMDYAEFAQWCRDFADAAEADGGRAHWPRRQALTRRLEPARGPRGKRGSAAPAPMGDTGDMVFRAIEDGHLEWLDILPEGWSAVWEGSGKEYFLRPGDSTQAQSGNALGALLTIHSQSVDWAARDADGLPRAMTPMHVIAAVSYDDDYGAAAKALEENARRLAVDGQTPDPPFDRWPADVLVPIHVAREEWLNVKPRARGDDEGDGARTLRIRPASDITPARVLWLWQDYIPAGHLALVAGREGEGKSTVVCDVIADVTRGDHPGEFTGTPRNVMMVATEDDWSTVILPRLMAAGADLERVLQITVQTDSGIEDFVDLPSDLLAFEEAITEHDVALVVLDPLISRLSATLDTHKDQETRQALEPLVAIAQRSGAAVVGLIHLNKSTASNPLDRVMASKAFTAVARVVLVVVADMHDQTGQQKLLAVAKNNLGPKLPMRAFTITQKDVPTPEGASIRSSRIEWGPVVVGDLAAHINGERTVPETSKDGKAREWLKGHLTERGGSAPADEIYEAGLEVGHNERRLRRVKQQIGIVSEAEDKYQPKWTWRMPTEGDREPVPRPQLRQERNWHDTDEYNLEFDGDLDEDRDDE